MFLEIILPKSLHYLLNKGARGIEGTDTINEKTPLYYINRKEVSQR
jgi:hypothetical protein